MTRVLIAPVTVSPTKALTPSHIKGLLWVDVMHRATALVADVTYRYSNTTFNTTRQTLVLDPRKSIKLTMAGAPMTGERNLVLVPLGKNKTRIDVSWRFQVNDVPGFVQGIVRGQISKATEEAPSKPGAETAPAPGAATPATSPAS